MHRRVFKGDQTEIIKQLTEIYGLIATWSCPWYRTQAFNLEIDKELH